jgi:sugar lactone lactonase YvrE
VAALDPAGGPNDLAFDDADNLFVTDPVLGRVWKVDAGGNVSVFVEDPLLAGDPADPALIFRPLGVNGVAFDTNERFLYLANTDQGTILRVRTRGQSPAVEVFAEDARLRGADGIAFDRGGTLLVNVNATDSIASVSRAGRVRLLAQGGLLDAPSSAVFGATQADRRQVYVTASAFSRTLGLQDGEPRPALLVADVQAPGLPLP